MLEKDLRSFGGWKTEEEGEGLEFEEYRSEEEEDEEEIE